jgi:zinc/manganese transport system substrate-binding protein
MVITVGDLFGAKEGSNPHLWYDPSDVDRVVAAITADLKKLDPNDGAYYDRQRVLFESHDLAAYHRWIALISKRYGGTPVGASESIFAEQAPSLGLDLKTPPSFMKAISEGTDVTAQDVLTAQGQIETHAIKVWIYNSQNATPQIQRLNALARRDHVPLATITETLSPASATFEQWQVAQLQRIAGALHAATGR